MRALRVDGWVVAIFLVAAAAHPWPAAALTCGSLGLTQSSSHAVVSGNSGACIDAMTGFTRENSYYRAFQPLAGPFSVCAVEIGVELAQAGGGGSQPLTANLYTNAGAPFPGGTLSLIGTATVAVPDQTLSLFSIPVAGTVAAGVELVVEISIADGVAAGNRFFIGSNGAGQSEPSYVRAPACGFGAPVPTSDPGWGFPDMHIVMDAEGNGPPAPAPALGGFGLVAAVMVLAAIAGLGWRGGYRRSGAAAGGRDSEDRRACSGEWTLSVGRRGIHSPAWSFYIMVTPPRRWSGRGR